MPKIEKYIYVICIVWYRYIIKQSWLVVKAGIADGSDDKWKQTVFLSTRPAVSLFLLWLKIYIFTYNGNVIIIWLFILYSRHTREGNKNKYSSFPTWSSLRYFGFIANHRQAKALHRMTNFYDILFLMALSWKSERFFWINIMRILNVFRNCILVNKLWF